MAAGDDSRPTPSERSGSRAGRSRRTVLDPRLVQFLLFAANGAAVGLIYSVAVWSFIAASPRTFTLDVVAAYAIAVLGNYVGSRLIFKPVTTPRAHLPRYLTVIVGNFLLTALLAWLLERLGAPRLIAAYAPVVVTAIPSFVLMKSWVFGAAAPGAVS